MMQDGRSLRYNRAFNYILIVFQNFYTEFRQSMLYPVATEEGRTQWVKPASKEAWLQGRHTVKMEVLADIVTYHLRQDGAPPLTMQDDGQHVSPVNDASPDSDMYAECDRIVIYSAFPSANPVIKDVSHQSFATVHS